MTLQMAYDEKYREGLETGIQQGIEQGITTSARRMLSSVQLLIFYPLVYLFFTNNNLLP